MNRIVAGLFTIVMETRILPRLLDGPQQLRSTCHDLSVFEKNSLSCLMKKSYRKPHLQQNQGTRASCPVGMTTGVVTMSTRLLGVLYRRFCHQSGILRPMKTTPGLSVYDSPVEDTSWTSAGSGQHRFCHRNAVSAAASESVARIPQIRT